MNPRKQEQKEQRLRNRDAALSGTGTYLFQNNTKGDFYLPRPTKTGQRIVRKDQQFIGDSYYFQFCGNLQHSGIKAKSNELRFIQEVKQPMPQEKLITEVPPTVTHEGTVEYVRQTSNEKLNEEKDKNQVEVLLTEDPLDGIKLLNS